MHQAHVDKAGRHYQAKMTAAATFANRDKQREAP